MLASCKTHTTTTVTSNGRKRTLPTPQKFIKFQGTDFTIKGVTFKLQPKTGETGNVEAGVGEISFATKFREASDMAIILDNAQFRDAQNLIAAASTMSDAEFNQRLARISDEQQKLDQLALIVSAKDSAALQKWVDNYFQDNKLSNQKPVTNTALGLKQF